MAKVKKVKKSAGNGAGDQSEKKGEGVCKVFCVSGHG